jgi:hypothetical protein
MSIRPIRGKYIRYTDYDFDYPKLKEFPSTEFCIVGKHMESMIVGSYMYENVNTAQIVIVGKLNDEDHKFIIDELDKLQNWQYFGKKIYDNVERVIDEILVSPLEILMSKNSFYKTKGFKLCHEKHICTKWGNDLVLLNQMISSGYECLIPDDFTIPAFIARHPITMTVHHGIPDFSEILNNMDPQKRDNYIELLNSIGKVMKHDMDFS